MNWLDYFRMCASKFDFVLWQWDYDGDMNLRAFASKAAFTAWFGQPPGPWHVHGVPSHRDESFYTRELATVSMLVRPKRVVEFGTALGIGAILLQLLNPDAEVTTVDIADTMRLPDQRFADIGYLAIIQDTGINFIRCDSVKYVEENVDLCFIDGDHSYAGASADTARAWANRNPERGAIVWHDHNERHPGVLRAVAEFEYDNGLPVNREPDSATVWASWGCCQTNPTQGI